MFNSEDDRRASTNIGDEYQWIHVRKDKPTVTMATWQLRTGGFSDGRSKEGGIGDEDLGIDDDSWKLVVPMEDREMVLLEYHNTA